MGNLLSNKYVSFLIIITVNLLATTGDITLSWTSPVFPILYSANNSENPLGRSITQQEDSIIGSILNLGAIIGPLPFSIMSHKFGFKKTFLCLAIPHITSFLILAFATHVYLFYIARFLAGLSLGAGYSLFSLYIGEISEDSNRGSMVVITNIFWSLGNFIPLAIGPYLSIKVFNLILTCIPVIFFILFLKLGIESPYYLIRNQNEEKAEEALEYLRRCRKESVTEEINKIKDFVENGSEGYVVDIITDKILRKSIFICVVLLATQDLGGYCSILYHLELIFSASGSRILPDTASLFVGFILLLSSFLAPLLIDYCGRKLLLILSSAGMCISLALIGLFFYLYENNFDTHGIQFLPLLSVIFYIISYNLGINTVPWTLVSEFFPDKVKQAASSIAAFSCWMTTAIVTFSYNPLNNVLGIYGTFWLFSGWCLLSCIFCIIFVPETKGKSFSEVQKMLHSNQNSTFFHCKK